MNNITKICIKFKKMEKIILNLKEKVIVLFFLILILIVSICVFLLISSTMKIDIQNLEFQYPKNNAGKKENHKIFLKLYLLDKIKILKIDLTKIKIEKKLETDIKKNRNKFDMNFLEFIRKINITVEKLDLKIDIGAEDAALTAILSGTLYTFISVIINSIIKKETKYKFDISPIYNKFVINLKLNCIIKIKKIHIINIIYILLQKRRVESDGRTSNRRSYAYSNE